MAQWLELEQLGSEHLEQVSKLFGENFPMEIRQYLAPWIESKKWDLAAEDVYYATDCFHELLRRLEEQENRFNMGRNVLQMHNFRRIKEKLQNQYQEDPVHLAMIISKCLNNEKAILDSALNAQVGTPNTQEAEKEKAMDKNVKDLTKIIRKAECDVKSLVEQQEDTDFRRRTLTQCRAKQANGKVSPEAQNETLLLQAKSVMLNKTKQEVVNQLSAILGLVEKTVYNLLAVELPEWKRRQQLACIGGPHNTCLDQLQMWFTAVVEGIRELQQQLKKLEEQEEKYNPNSELLVLIRGTFEERTQKVLKSLLLNALVVERQPRMANTADRPLILKTGNRFDVKVRFLVALPEFKYMQRVKAAFDKGLNETTTFKGYRKFHFDRSTKNNPINNVFELQDCSGSLAVEFRTLSLKEQKRSVNKSTENPPVVAEELHLITFETHLHLPGLELDIETSSLPVVVFSSTSQIPSAWASIMWYNMLTSELDNLSFFRKPPTATWQQLSEVLSWQFSSISQRGLNSDQLSMLRDKLLGQNVSDPETPIQWTKFCKNNGFWMWLDGILDLVKKYLVPFWNNGSIVGFMTRNTADALLMDSLPGTFLLRFSESNRDGAISISWVDSVDGDKCVHAVAPFLKKDLNAQSLAHQVRNYHLLRSQLMINPLLYLYPDVPIDHAFQLNDSQPEMMNPPVGDGYVGRIPMNVSKMDSTLRLPPTPPQPTQMEIPEEMDFMVSSFTTDDNFDSFEEPMPPHPFVADDDLMVDDLMTNARGETIRALQPTWNQVLSGLSSTSRADTSKRHVCSSN